MLDNITPAGAIRKEFISEIPALKHQHKISYLTWGNPDLPPLLCVHGLTMNGRDFNRLAQRLSDEFYVICPDMIGRGESEWVENKLLYNYGTYLHDLLGLLDHLKIQQLHWVGTSMGGILGMMAASHQPERIKALVINDIGKLIPKDALTYLTTYVGQSPTFSSWQMAEEYIKINWASFGIKAEDDWQEFINNRLKNHNNNLISNYDQEIFAYYRQETKNFSEITDINLSETWDKITCPILLLHGETSDILPTKVAEEMQQDKGKLLTLKEFAGIGHAPALLDEEQIKIVADWVREHG